MIAQKSNRMLHDLAEAVAESFDVVCSAIIIENRDSPLHCVGDKEIGQRLIQHPAVQASLADGIARTEEPPTITVTDEAALIGIQPLSTGLEETATIIVFALRDPDDIARAVPLVHALATETANQLTLLREAPFLETALTEVDSGIAVADPNLADCPLIYVNEAFTRITGYSRAEALGRNCRFLQGHLRDQPGIQTIRNALAQGVDCTTVLTNIRKNGEAFQNKFRMRPIRGADGKISHIIGIQNDITTEQSALKSLDLQKRRHKSLIESSASHVWHMDADGSLVYVDPSWLLYAGLHLPDDEIPDLTTIRKALTPEAEETFRQRWLEALHKIEAFEVVYQLPANSPSPRWFKDTISPVRDDAGNLLEWFGVSQDITPLKKAEQYLERTIQGAPTGMLVINQEGIIELANPHVAELFGYSVHELTGMNVDALVPTSLQAKHRQLRRAFTDKPSVRHMGSDRQVRGLRKDGTEFDTEIGLSWYGKSPEVKVIAAVADTTELNKARRALERAAYHDRLTGLLSREGFASHLEDFLTHGDLHPASKIVAIDIAGLREINNAQGYDIGDQVLQEIGRHLSAALGPQSLVARSGGDEFLVLIPIDRERTPDRRRNQIESVFDAPFQIKGFTLYVNVVFGYVRIGKHPPEARTLMNNAELALRKSQNEPSRRWSEYTDALERENQHAVTLTNELRLALENDDLLLHYQPKVALRKGHVLAAEALLRWKHPEKGSIPPDQFIPRAEVSQLIGPIGEWVLRKTCSDLKAWQDAGLEVKPVSVNVSLHQFQLGNFPELVEKTLTDFGISAHLLSLEITESVFERHRDSLKEDLYRLAEIGVKLSLDDFGTGYSSLQYLKDYPFDEIKIDKSFVWQLDEGIYGRAIIKAVETIATSIDAQIVAEGVETGHHADILQGLGCNIGQGFYYHRPLPEPEWRQLLETAKTDAS